MSLTIVLGPHENPRIDAMNGAQRLRWVLKFIRRDLEGLPAEEVASLGDDLLHATAPWWVRALWREGKIRKCTEMPALEVRALQQDIRKCVQTVMDETIDMTQRTKILAGLEAPRGWVVPESPARLLRIRFCADYECIVRVSDSPNDRTAILTGVGNLLTENSARLLTCRVCGTPFLRQYRQEYCQVRCSNRIRNKRRLDRKADQRKSHKRGARSQGMRPLGAEESTSGHGAPVL